MRKHGKSGKPGKRRKNMPGYYLGINKIGNKSWFASRRPEDIDKQVKSSDLLGGDVPVGSIMTINKTSNAIFLGVSQGKVLHYNPRNNQFSYSDIKKFEKEDDKIYLLKDKVGSKYFEENKLLERKIPGSDLKIEDFLNKKTEKTAPKNLGDEFSMSDYHKSAIVGDVSENNKSGLKSEVVAVTKNGIALSFLNGRLAGRKGYLNLKNIKKVGDQYTLVKKVEKEDTGADDIKKKFKNNNYKTVKTDNGGAVASQGKIKSKKTDESPELVLKKHIDDLKNADELDIQKRFEVVNKITSHLKKFGSEDDVKKYKKLSKELKTKIELSEKYDKAENLDEKHQAAKLALSYERKLNPEGSTKLIELWSQRSLDIARLKMQSQLQSIREDTPQEKKEIIEDKASKEDKEIEDFTEKIKLSDEDAFNYHYNHFKKEATSELAEKTTIEMHRYFDKKLSDLKKDLSILVNYDPDKLRVVVPFNHQWRKVKMYANEDEVSKIQRNAVSEYKAYLDVYNDLVPQLDLKFADLTPVDGLANVFKDKRGNEWLIRSFEDVARSQNEILNSNLLKLAGVNSQDVLPVIFDKDSVFNNKNVSQEQGVALKYDGELKAYTGSNDEQAKLFDSFAAYAWLSNWGVRSPENLSVRKDGSIHYPSDLGALAFNQNGLPNYEILGGSVDDINNFGQNDIFEKMSKEQVKKSMEKIAQIKDDDIKKQVQNSLAYYVDLKSKFENLRLNDYIKNLSNTLIERKNYIRFRLDELSREKTRNLNLAASNRLNDDDTQRISKSKADGIAIKTDSNEIEDQQILFHHEIDGENKQTVATLKLTDKGYDKVRSLLKVKGGDFEYTRARMPRKTIDSDGNLSLSKTQNGETAYFISSNINIGHHYIGNIGGATVKIWGQSADTPFAIKNYVEIVTPGDDKEAANKALGALGALGINVLESTYQDKEEIYLTKILKQRGGREFSPVIQKIDKIEDQAERVKILKESLSSNLGVEDVTKLPNYNPEPVSAHQDGYGGLVLYRPDLSHNKKEEWESFAEKYSLVHNPLYNEQNTTFAKRIKKMLDDGTTNLASAVDRLRRGFTTNTGAEDMRTGGGSYVFTTIVEKKSRGVGFYWKVDEIGRLDSISYNQDNYGRMWNTEIKSGEQSNSTEANFVDNNRVVGLNNLKHAARYEDNETLFKNNLSILHNLEKIVVPAPKLNLNDVDQAYELIELFHSKGIKTLPDGRRIEEIIEYEGGVL